MPNTIFREKKLSYSRKGGKHYGVYDCSSWHMRGGNAAVVCLHSDERRWSGMMAVIQYILYLAILVLLAVPLGAYIKKIMNGEKTFLSKILTPCENLVYKIMKMDKGDGMAFRMTDRNIAAFFIRS